MRGFIRSFILVLGVGLISSQAALTQEPITLENAELRVSLSPQNATLLSVQKKQTNASYLGSSKQAVGFGCRFLCPTGKVTRPRAMI